MISRDLIRNIKNIPGWHTRRKIIVIESDDWGSIRMPSKEAFSFLVKEGLDMTSGDSGRFNSFDTLASSEDLAALFEVLSRHRDKNGRGVIFTAMSVMANPDFDQIRESDFSEYFYEPFTDTINKYYPGESTFKLWREGMEAGIFIPQFHGREHLNAQYWLRNLQENDPETKLAFNQGLWGIKRLNEVPGMPRYQAAFDLADPGDMELHASILKDGLDIFEQTFGYRARYFVPPNGQLNNSLNEILVKSGIQFRSTTSVQMEPVGMGNYRKVYHYLGQRSRDGLTYILRNAVFEPSSRSRDWVSSCLKDINDAFRWRRPAIINSHRVNFVGSLDKSNRDHGLQQLDLLLKAILKKWPEAEFLSTIQLGELISGENPKTDQF